MSTQRAAACPPNRGSPVTDHTRLARAASSGTRRGPPYPCADAADRCRADRSVPSRRPGGAVLGQGCIGRRLHLPARDRLVGERDCARTAGRSTRLQ